MMRRGAQHEYNTEKIGVIGGGLGGLPRPAPSLRGGTR